MFMMSSGGLTDASFSRAGNFIQGGGIVGAVETSKLAGFDKIIGFDMGTSTDVTHYDGQFETDFETDLAACYCAPMMKIHTVAAGEVDSAMMASCVGHTPLVRILGLHVTVVEGHLR